LEMLPQLTQFQFWYAEDLLDRLAEDRSRPPVSLGSDVAGRTKYRDAWAAWWKEHGPTVDLSKLQQTPGSWVALFNGRNLTGWKTFPSAPGNWSVENGLLIGRGPQISYLYTER